MSRMQLPSFMVAKSKPFQIRCLHIDWQDYSNLCAIGKNRFGCQTRLRVPEGLTLRSKFDDRNVNVEIASCG